MNKQEIFFWLLPLLVLALALLFTAFSLRAHSKLLLERHSGAFDPYYS